MTLPKEPLSRQEQYLNKIAVGEGEIPLKPYSRVEQYLDYICKNGGIGGNSNATTDLGVCKLDPVLIDYPEGLPAGYGSHGISIVYKDNTCYVAYSDSVEESNHIAFWGGSASYPQLTAKGDFYYYRRNAWAKGTAFKFDPHGTIGKTTVNIYTDSSYAVVDKTPDFEFAESISVAEVQQVRGNTANINKYKGKQGQIVINTDDNSIHIMDGKTLGGYKIEPVSSVYRTNISNLEERVSRLESTINNM